MAIDNALYISDMDINSPADIDDVAEGAGQIRAVKAALKRTFPMFVEGQGANSFARMPLGGIITYSGSQEELDKTPEWALCDGRTVNSRQTPNLVDRFIMGGTIDKIGLTGGSNTRNAADGLSVNGHSLSTNEIPYHSHEFTGDDKLANTGYFPIIQRDVWDVTGEGSDGWHSPKALTKNMYDGNNSRQNGGAAHSHGLSGSAVENRPSYYTLAYIMFVGYAI